MFLHNTIFHLNEPLFRATSSGNFNLSLKGVNDGIQHWQVKKAIDGNFFLHYSVHVIQLSIMQYLIDGLINIGFYSGSMFLCLVCIRGSGVTLSKVKAVGKGFTLRFPSLQDKENFKALVSVNIDMHIYIYELLVDKHNVQLLFTIVSENPISTIDHWHLPYSNQWATAATKISSR